MSTTIWLWYLFFISSCLSLPKVGFMKPRGHITPFSFCYIQHLPLAHNEFSTHGDWENTWVNLFLLNPELTAKDLAQRRPVVAVLHFLTQWPWHVVWTLGKKAFRTTQRARSKQLSCLSGTWSNETGTGVGLSPWQVPYATSEGIERWASKAEEPCEHWLTSQ